MARVTSATWLDVAEWRSPRNLTHHTQHASNISQQNQTMIIKITKSRNNNIVAYLPHVNLRLCFRYFLDCFYNRELPSSLLDFFLGMISHLGENSRNETHASGALGRLYIMKTLNLISNRKCKQNLKFSFIYLCSASCTWRNSKRLYIYVDERSMTGWGDGGGTVDMQVIHLKTDILASKRRWKSLFSPLVLYKWKTNFSFMSFAFFMIQTEKPRCINKPRAEEKK